VSSALELSGKRQLLLEKLLRQKGVATGTRPAIAKRTGSGPAPLSFGQQRLWFLHQLEPEATAYNISEAVRLRGGLDIASLARALTETSRRHEVLRTVYAMVDGEPRQIVQPAAPVSLPLVRLTRLPSPRREAEARQIAAAIAAQPFDLGFGPVLRAALLELDREDHVLVLSLHHIAIDGWSMVLLVRELTLLYGALIGGAPSPLPELPLQYSDFAAWQRGWLQGETLESQLRYWRENLAGAPTQLALPVDRPWPAVQTSRGGRTEIQVDTGTAACLRDLARSQGATLFMVLLGGLAALLRRITGQDDLLLGTPAAGRGRPEIEGLIGFFINTLVLRADLSGDPDLLTLISRIKDTVLGADAHQDLPFERLIDALELPRDLSRSPLFQVLLAFQNLPPVEEQPGTLDLAPFPFAAQQAQFELHFALVDTPGELFGVLEYRTELFDATSARRLVRHFEALLAGIARAPRSSFSQLSLLSPAEEQQLVREWNDTAVAYAWRRERRGLHHLCEEQAARTPGKIAASCEGESLTCAELDARANRLARHLRSLGCGPETRVAIAMERSLELLVALLGTLKSGAAYVPLDPEYPRERLAFMLDDARPAVLLTQERLRAALPTTAAPILTLHADGRESRDRDGGALDERADDLQLAYVIYTSGSTGRPKGAMVHHAGIRNRLAWMQEAYALGPADTVLQKTPYSFDVSVWEFFWPLLAGARVAFARPGEHRDPAALVSRIAAERVTVLHFVPSMLQAFLAEPDLSRCGSLRLVVCSGEALPPELVRRFHERLPGVRLENLYGPTEASVDVTSWGCSAASGHRTVPIGRPIANTRIQLLDRGGLPVPIGIAGELAIGGINVGRGYLERPDLTADRFVPDPFAEARSEAPGARLYRTGDLSRHRSDGAIEYLGRIDHQVKVRGFRIELGEIENVLTLHPAVREAAVTVRDVGGSRQLVACVVMPASGAVETEELRRFVLERLPEHMAPAFFVVLDALPLSPNGKLDRQSLPAPSPAAAGVEFESPATVAEETLAFVWAETLGLDRVGVRDNFFSLGGDSILSLRVVARARELGLSFTLQQIFQHQTVRDLARAAQTGEPGNATTTAPFSLISAGDRERVSAEVEDAYPLTRLQAGMLFHSELEPETAVYHDIFSTHLQARFDEAALRQAVAETVARHPVLRTSFDLTTFSEPLQLVHRETVAEVEIEDLRAFAEGAREELIAGWMQREQQRALDWRRPPLLRIGAHRRSPESFQFALSFHHAILDGWSLSSLISELFQHYVAFSRGDDPPRDEVPSGVFRRFVALEQLAIASAESQRYWDDLLDEAPDSALPRLRPRETVRRGPGTHEAPLPRQLSADLLEAARNAGLPVKSLLLAVHCRVLAALTGQPEVVTGLVANGRPEETGADRVLGLFLNTVPLRLSLHDGSWSELARRAFAAELALLPHRRYPLAELQRQAGGRPLFEAVFNYVHFHAAQRLADFDEIRSLGGEYVEQTNFAFLASFSQSPFTGQLHLRLEYDPREFPQEQIATIAAAYERTLAALAGAAPGEHHEDFSLLSAGQRDQVLVAWNGTSRPEPETSRVHDLFAAQAARTPDAVAVEADGSRLTYRELLARSESLARFLSAHGAGPDALVGLCLERSPAMAAAVLGTLRAGGAYVPLDPSYPAERLAVMVEDADLRLFIADEGTRDRLSPALSDRRARIVVLDPTGDVMDGGGEPATQVPDGPGGATLAYLLYTSGSTGRPKGVAMPHASLVNLIAWQAGESPEPLRTLQLAPLGFDVSFQEMFATWATGGTIVMVDEDVRRDPVALLALLQEARIQRLFLPFVALQQIAEAAVYRAVFPAMLREVVTAGEQLQTTGAITEFFRRLPGCRLYNQYGPTEAHVVTALQLPDEPGTWPTLPPIGRPIANLRIYLLDRRLEPVLPGTPAELCIGGAGLARGYLNKPRLTAERFVPDPHGGSPGGRLYRTGDLARHLPDGTIGFLGRADQQVKVRGFRVEPGEIEAVLASHPGVREAAVVVRGEGNAKRLVAYFSPRPGQEPASAELARALRDRLPDYMVPGAFVRLDSLPLTSSGKVSRRALPDPVAVSASSVYEAPRTPIEQMLAEIWGAVLKLDRVGVEDNLFAIGGHSLIATRIVARIREAFQIDLPLRALYDAPTIARLAVAVVTAQAEKADADLLEQLLAEVEEMPRMALDAELSGAPPVGGLP
jgi:amino acid adenylation domain-containing protein